MKSNIIISVILASILFISIITANSSIASSSSDSNSSGSYSDSSFSFSSESSGEQHYIYAFTINLNPGEGQFFSMIDPSTNKVLKYVPITTPQDYVIQSILGFKFTQESNLIYVLGLSGLNAANQVFSYDIVTGRIEQVDQTVPQFDMGYAIQPFIYTPSGVAYMAVEPLSKNILALAEWNFPIGKHQLIELSVPSYSTKIYPLLAYDEQSELIYVIYSPSNSNETNLIIVDSKNPKTQKQFNSIQNITSSENNVMLLTSPTNQSVYLIQVNSDNNGIDMCEFDLSTSSSDSSICNNVMSVTMVKDLLNVPFNPFQLTLDNSGLMMMNYATNDSSIIEVNIIDLDSLFPIASYSINNYFNSTNPDFQYYVSYY